MRALLLLSLLSLACSSGETTSSADEEVSPVIAALEDEPDTPARDPFIALTRDFADFLSWRRFALEDPIIPANHPDGPAAVYVNHMPPEGERRFPVGTILVKTIETGPQSDWAMHAMVKRGAGYGRELPGWELFELRFAEDTGPPTILWRGEGAPTGFGYAAPAPNSDEVVQLVCMDCHASAWANDSVLNRHVRLAYGQLP